MKQATGEANLTVITIVLIGIVLALGMLIVPKVSKNIKPKACCENARGKWENGKCIAINTDLYSEAEYEKCIQE